MEQTEIKQSRYTLELEFGEHAEVIEGDDYAVVQFWRNVMGDWHPCERLTFEGYGWQKKLREWLLYESN